MSIFELFVRNRSIFKVFSIFKEIEHQTQYSLPLFHYSSPFFYPYLKKPSNKKIYNILGVFSRKICGNFCKSWKRVTIDSHKKEVSRNDKRPLWYFFSPYYLLHQKPFLDVTPPCFMNYGLLVQHKTQILILRFNQTICMTFSLIYNIYFICFHITEYVEIMS